MPIKAKDEIYDIDQQLNVDYWFNFTVKRDVDDLHESIGFYEPTFNRPETIMK